MPGLLCPGLIYPVAYDFPDGGIVELYLPYGSKAEGSTSSIVPGITSPPHLSDTS